MQALQHMDLTDLVQFGRAADEQRPHWVSHDGFIVSGRSSPSNSSRGKEQSREQPTGTEETGPAARARPGRRASATAAGAAAHPVERELRNRLGLEGLLDYYRDARWTGSSSSGTELLVLKIGLFGSLSFRAVLGLEIPRKTPKWLTDAPVAYAPFVRAWAWWSDGSSVHAPHVYPDGAMCVCREEDWKIDVQTVHDYADFCVCWIAKALHLQILGRWPGPQHMPAGARIVRNRPNDFCGCGQFKRYKDCHMRADFRMPRPRWLLERKRAEDAYLQEIRRRLLAVTRPPFPLERRES
jgi:hypothetical protein